MNPSLTLVLPLSLIVLSRLRQRDIDRAMTAALALTAVVNMLLIGLQWRAGFPGPVPNTSGVHVLSAVPLLPCLELWAVSCSREPGGAWFTRPWMLAALAFASICRSTPRGRP
ncbi:MAG: hypothetical protein ACYCSR_09000 [Thiomonas sp.]